MSETISKNASIYCLLVAITIVAVVFSAKLSGCGPIELLFKDEYDLFRSLRPGMSEQEVTEALGTAFRVYDKSSASGSYYVEGYAYKERPVTNKVLIYIGVEAIAYVYIDDDGKVDDVFVGGS